MRVLIVDGHSVIFAWPEIRALHARRTALARNALVKALTEYQDNSDVHVVAVFDGKGPRASETTEPGGIQIFYSGANQTADNIIERLVAKYSQRHDITVATSDPPRANDRQYLRRLLDLRRNPPLSHSGSPPVPQPRTEKTKEEMIPLAMLPSA